MWSIVVEFRSAKSEIRGRKKKKERKKKERRIRGKTLSPPTCRAAWYWQQHGDCYNRCQSDEQLMYHIANTLSRYCNKMHSTTLAWSWTQTQPGFQLFIGVTPPGSDVAIIYGVLTLFADCTIEVKPSFAVVLIPMKHLI